MRRVLGGIVAVAALALASRATLPVGPVPITLQSLAVVLAGAWLGPVTGAAAVVAWLMLAALGAPVLAGGEGGPGRFAGPSAGFLYAFPLAAALAGALAGRGWDRSFARALLLALAAHALCLIGGAAWLAATVGWGRAWAGGVAPFLPGAAAKSLAAAAMIRAVRR